MLVAPAMNVRMWEHPATQANVATLRERGVELIGPEEGELAEGESGLGRMSEPEAIFARVRELLGETDSPRRARRVLVTAGGTREPLDAVRFIGNRSSGRMGVALAEEARRRGARVTLLAANLAVPAPAGVEVVETPTAAALAREAKARADVDVVLMAAAVADYAPEPVEGKRPKTGAAVGARASSRPRTSSAGFGESKNGHGARRLRRRGGRGGARAQAADARRRSTSTSSSSTTSRGRTSASTRPRTRSCWSPPTASGRCAKAPKERIAAEILDEVERLLAAQTG